MHELSVDDIASSWEREIVIRRSLLVFHFYEIRDKVAFILDSARRPNVENIMKSAVSVDVRTLRSEDIEGGDPIHFSEMQMRAVGLLAELYFEIQAIKEDLIRNPNIDELRYFLEPVWKLRCIAVNANIANRWIAADLPYQDSPGIEEIVAFINQEYGKRQSDGDIEAHRNFSPWMRG